MLQRLLDLIFPPRCAVCGHAGEVVCAACRAKMLPPAMPRCEHCGLTLPAAAPLCPACADGVGPMRLACLRAATEYAGPAREAILALKYRQQRAVAAPLAHLLAQAVAREGIGADLIAPVPLHSSRRRERGFDQAELLARDLARELRVPLRADLLRRIRATRIQRSLSAAERGANVAGAFALAGGNAAEVLRGKRVLLVDDVATTGATLDAAAAALHSGDPASIIGLVVARPRLDRDWHTQR
jgi:ComF family protein